jgi:NAD(P)H-dependent FMN reductase
MTSNRARPLPATRIPFINADPRILVVCGSLSAASHTRTLVELVADRLSECAVTVDRFDLAEHPLAPADPAYYNAADAHPDASVRTLSALAAAADGFVFGSPIYHNSYSGALKNCLDHLSPEYFSYKPIGLVAHGGRWRSVQPCDHLRLVVRALGGTATTAQVVTADSDYVLADGAYRLTNRDVDARISAFVDELALYTRLFRPVRATVDARAASASVALGRAE